MGRSEKLFYDIGPRSQFFYTITFLLIPLIFYLTEFLTLTPEYEPTGLRSRLARVCSDLRNPNLVITIEPNF